MEPRYNVYMNNQNATLNQFQRDTRAQHVQINSTTNKINTAEAFKKINIIIQNLNTKLKEYIAERTNLSFIDSLVFDSELTKNRLKLIAQPLSNRLNLITIMTVNVFSEMTAEIQIAFSENNLLTVTAEANGIGELGTLLGSTLNKLSEYDHLKV